MGYAGYYEVDKARRVIYYEIDEACRAAYYAVALTTTPEVLRAVVAEQCVTPACRKALPAVVAGGQ